MSRPEARVARKKLPETTRGRNLERKVTQNRMGDTGGRIMNDYSSTNVYYKVKQC